MIEQPLEVEVSLDRDDYFFRVLKDKDAKKAINGTQLDTSYFNLGETYEVWKLLESGEAIYFWGGCKGISETWYMEREDWEEVVLFEVIGEPKRGKENKMPKINQEEYEVLKWALNEGYEWITRDKHDTLCTHRHKPVKKDHWTQKYWGNIGNRYTGIDDNLLQFIQWEDEPYNISELIEEYESNKEIILHEDFDVDNISLKELDGFKQTLDVVKESVGTEVKPKQELIEKWESAIESAEFYGKGKEERLISYMKDFVSDLNQLDEPEVLSQEFIDEHSKLGAFSYSNGIDIGYFVKVGALEDKLVPKQEKPLVDKEDAKNIVKYKSKGWTLSHLLNDVGVDAGHDELLARAWIGYPNIEVEEEQGYYVMVEAEEHGGVWFLYKNSSGDVSIGINKDYSEVNWSELKLTEQEIKDYSEKYWPFAVKVEELEE